MAGIFETTEKMDLIDDLNAYEEEVIKTVYEMLKIYRDRKGFELFYDYNPYVHFMACTLDHYGLLEYGTSIRSAWLTEKGEKTLEALEAFEKYGFDRDKLFEDMPNEFYVEV